MTEYGRTFLGLDEAPDFEKAEVVLQSVPYDGTSTWGKGADRGFEAFLDAAENMELYDIETDSEVYRKGIFLPEAVTEDSSPEAMSEATYRRAKKLIESGKFPTFFGGEHSISIGIIKAFYEHYANLSVLQLDAHTDLRPQYGGTPYNHACALHDASRHTSLVQVGIRSMDASEREWLNRDRCFFAEAMHGNTQWMDDAIAKLSGPVYITLDLDVLDPSIMPATGTPEPGGLDWNRTIQFLNKVFSAHPVVGFDIVELAPIPDFAAPDFLAAKLYYKMLSYKFADL